MSRKLLTVGLFAMACTVTLYANTAAADEAPAPRAVVEGDKKVEGKSKFGGFGKGGFDPAKLKEFKDKFGKEGGFGGKGGFDKSKIDPKKLEELKGKFGGKGGSFGKKKDGNEKE